MQSSLSSVKTTPETEPAEATSSSIVASGHILASRLPVHFPSSEPRRCSPRKKAQVEEQTRVPSPRQQPRSSRRSSPRKRPSSTSGHSGSQMPPPKRDAHTAMFGISRTAVRDQPHSYSRSSQSKLHQGQRQSDVNRETARNQGRKGTGQSEAEEDGS